MFSWVQIPNFTTKEWVYIGGAVCVGTAYLFCRGLVYHNTVRKNKLKKAIADYNKSVDEESFMSDLYIETIEQEAHLAFIKSKKILEKADNLMEKVKNDVEELGRKKCQELRDEYEDEIDALMEYCSINYQDEYPLAPANSFVDLPGASKESDIYRANESANYDSDSSNSDCSFVTCEEQDRCFEGSRGGDFT